jgi:lipopolysaccharide heptosyltransferase I
MEGQRILIVKPSAFGDIVHSLPFLHVLRRGFPDAHIAWVVGRPYLDLLEGHPEIDEIVVFERERWGRWRRLPLTCVELFGFVRRLRRKRFDLVVDLQGLIRSGLLSWATGAPKRVGFADAREFSRHFYNVRVRVGDENMHAVERYLLVARELALEIRSRAEFNVHIPPEAHRFAEEFLGAANAQPRPVVVLLPSSRWATKRWPADCFAALADRVTAELDGAALFLGGAGDAALVERIRGMMKGRSLSLAGGTSIKQSAALLSRAAAVVANDSGPMHLAAALGAPVVALYGPTSPARTGPYGGNVRVLKSARECAPCFAPECDDPQCMRDISVEQVFDAVESFVTAGPKA